MPLKPLIIDCDTGRDDALAIWLALAMEMPLICVITSYGNTSLENVTNNTSGTLGLANRNDIDVFSCAKAPSCKHKGFSEVVLPRQKISGNGLCDISLPNNNLPKAITANPEQLAEKLTQLANIHGLLDYIITGPATNFASLLSVDGFDVSKVIAQVTMMGGTFSPLYEELGTPDFNIICDPFAIKDILNSGVKTRFVSLNTTWNIKLSLNEVKSLKVKNNSTIGAAAKKIMLAHLNNFAPEPIFRFHDPSVITALHKENLFKKASLSIDCDEKSNGFGRITASEDYSNSFVFECDDNIKKEFLNTILDSLDLLI